MKLPLRDSVDCDVTSSMSGNEVVARRLMKDAIDRGSFTAIEMILDRIEGKPGKSAANKPDNSQLSDQLDANIESLNDFTKEEP